ncbi:MAG: sigma-70 family RNA polymerase sigma factor [Chloroflexi bacterium]|nr:sigma-70 family RNA polymerase sigma factor [Chloroflexota bacterium]
METTDFQSLFFQHYALVYRVLFRVVGNKEDAQDLALEAFWKLWQQSPAQLENPAGWLFRVATRLGYNALRAAKRRERYELETARQALESGQDPDRAVERADERRRVRGVLERMTERDAQLLVLRYSGLAYKEIAAALDISPNSVGTLLARAEEAFEKLYSDDSHSEGRSEGGPHASRR